MWFPSRSSLAKGRLDHYLECGSCFEFPIIHRENAVYKLMAEVKERPMAEQQRPSSQHFLLTFSSWLKKTEHEFDPPSHLFKPINDTEQMKTLWAALNAQTLLRRAFSASWLIDVSLPPRPLCRYRVVSVLILLSLVPFWLPAGTQEQKHGGQ